MDSDTPQPWRELPQAQIDQLHEDDLLAYEMGGTAHQVMQRADALGTQLDYSPDSIKALEHILALIYNSFPRGLLARLRRKTYSESQIWNMSIPWGAYLGETIRRTIGGKWRRSVESYPGQPGHYLVLPPESVIAPVSKVFKRLADGPADDVVSYYYMIRTIQEDPGRFKTLNNKDQQRPG